MTSPRRSFAPIVVLSLAVVAACSSADYGDLGAGGDPAAERDESADGASTGSDDVDDDAGARPPLVDGGGDASGDAAKPPVKAPKPPADLVKCLDQKPYVEGTCVATTVAGWPHPAQQCKYGSPIGTLTVTVADPSASQVATWIVDAGDSIPAIAHLKKSDPGNYLRALQSIASALMIQSGRIFPIAGPVGEDLGGGYYAYPFTKGVTNPCPTGEPHCYCRINSLSRADYCAYRAFQGKEAVAACRTRVGYGQGATQSWMNECIGNHSASWDKPVNEHIRAQVWVHIRDAGLTATSSGPAVVSALDSSYGIKSSTVAAFCK